MQKLNDIHIDHNY